ncbi:MAG: 3-isopropylmalate dehydrogenase [Oscillospiraceae bacterium]|nr:3-isopropylmalate dehydrogenase [Oscillospiraceae bacterium]
MAYKITLLPGDGIGPEVTEQAVLVLKAVSEKYGFNLEFNTALIGGIAIDETGSPLPNETVELCKNSDGVILGAVGGPKWDSLPGDQKPEKGLLGIRTALELFANLRPAIVHTPLRAASPLKDEILGDGLDIMIVRELTGGIYFGDRGREGDSAYDTERYSLAEVERIGRVAFELATKRGGNLCSVDKANVLESSRLWREVMIKLSSEYPAVNLSHMYVDNAAMQLVRAPRQFDVIVTSNIFGDILSDEASQITGSIGMLPSASLGAGKLGLYEPIHGSAPDIAGKGQANPIAAILSTAMMLRYSFNLPDAALSIESAVAKALESGMRTADIAENGAPSVSTAEMGRAIAEFV